MTEQQYNFGFGDTSWFAQARFGMFIHWGLYSLPARREWVKRVETLTTEDYQKYFEHFEPDLYNPRDWARMARQAGMQYFVITTKHHEGFCLWDTKYTDYKVTNTPHGRCLLTPMIEAFRAEGLKVGLYYSLLDWHHPEYTTDWAHPLRGNAEYRAADANRDMRKYVEYMRNQVTELLSQFGKIDLMWYDFSSPGKEDEFGLAGKGRDDWQSEELMRLTRELQPHILVNNRLDLPGASEFVTPEQTQPHEPLTDANGNEVLWEACQTFSGSWGYHRDEMTWKSVPQLLNMLISGVSMNGNLLLNVGPTARGEFDARAQDRLEGIGRWMHHHRRAILGCGPCPKELSPQPPRDCRYTYNPETKRLYVHLLAWPFRHLHLPNLGGGKVRYAQLLHDASEVTFTDYGEGHNVMANLPVVKPNVDVPVVEFFCE